MSTPDLVEAFYRRIWNLGDLRAASELLTTDFSFRGSLGAELKGRDAFAGYVRSIRSALAEYRCEILECVAEEDRAFAQMRFSGRHVGVFLGYPPTGRSVHWQGAASFRFEGAAISRLWVLGDLAGLEVVLRSNHAAAGPRGDPRETATSTNPAARSEAAQRVRAVIDRLDRDGYVIARSDGSRYDVRTVSISAGDGEALRRRVSSEVATRTIEIGLGYGVSALSICEGLIRNGSPEARHLVLDPFQSARFADCGLQVLEEAGVSAFVDHHAEPSQIALPAFLKEGRTFDLAFVDGNHRFDGVFLDLFYLGRLVRGGGIVMLDDYDLPGVRKAVSFFQANLGWTIEETAPVEDRSRWIVLRTSRHPDERDFRYFVEF